MTTKQLLGLDYTKEEIDELTEINPVHGLEGSKPGSPRIAFALLKAELTRCKRLQPPHLTDTVLINSWLCENAFRMTDHQIANERSRLYRPWISQFKDKRPDAFKRVFFIGYSQIGHSQQEHTFFGEFDFREKDKVIRIYEPIVDQAGVVEKVYKRLKMFLKHYNIKTHLQVVKKRPFQGDFWNCVMMTIEIGSLVFQNRDLSTLAFMNAKGEEKPTKPYTFDKFKHPKTDAGVRHFQARRREYQKRLRDWETQPFRGFA